MLYPSHLRNTELTERWTAGERRVCCLCLKYPAGARGLNHGLYKPHFSKFKALRSLWCKLSSNQNPSGSKCFYLTCNANIPVSSSCTTLVLRMRWEWDENRWDRWGFMFSVFIFFLTSVPCYLHATSKGHMKRQVDHWNFKSKFS